MISPLGAVNTFEGLSAELLAVDVSDRDALAQIAVSFAEALRLLEPDSPQMMLATLAQQILQHIIDDDIAEPAAALAHLAQALSSITRHLQQEDDGGAAALETAIDSLQKLQPAEATAPSDALPQRVLPQSQQLSGCPTDASQIDGDQELIRDFVAEALDHVSAAESSLLLLEENPDDLEQINTVLRAFHTIKGASSFLNLDLIQKLAHLSENLLARARDGEIQMTGPCADLALKSCDHLKRMISELRHPQDASLSRPPDGFDELLRQLSDPQAFSAQLIAAVCPDDAASTDYPPANDQPGQPEPPEQREKAASFASGHPSGPHEDHTVRVATKRLDDLVDLVGELVIAQSMITQSPEVQQGMSREFLRSLSHAGKIVRDLQDLAMSLRMVPLKGMFAKMNRLARDLARKSGKSVRFVTSGEATEIDRNMVEILTDPLVHMIRNAVDHGLESQAQRIERGKPAEGTVSLRAYHSVGNVVIEIQDDGRGLDTHRILDKAIASGKLESSSEPANEQIHSLIFQPGFSTAEKVTEVSGRGVGLDVVRQNIANLHGRVQVVSEPGRGTTFRLYLPLTTAIADAILVRVGSERFLLPTMAIERSFCAQPGSISHIAQGPEMVMFRGELLPIVRLHRLFDIDGTVTDPLCALMVVFCGGGKRCALMIDELLDHRQVVIKSLDKVSESVSGASGGAILGDGRVALILDADGLMNLALQQSQAHPVTTVSA
ncbi:MAG: chemotaxis protein CheA [Actinobacteria bacterium]|nr:chemotaxis protein CheA [Actinomycetota bacterium]